MFGPNAHTQLLFSKKTGSSFWPALEQLVVLAGVLLDNQAVTQVWISPLLQLLCAECLVSVRSDVWMKEIQLLNALLLRSITRHC